MSCGTLIALASAAAGTGMKMSAAADEQDAMNKVTNEAIARQTEFANKSKAVFNQNAENSTPEAFKNQLQQGQQRYLDASKSAQDAPLALAAPVLGNKSDQQTQQRLGNQANAGFMGYSNPAIEQGVGNTLSNARMNSINQQAQGWANILPLQLQAARNSEQGLSSAGGLVSSLGSIAGGLTNAGAFSGYQAAPAVNSAWSGFNTLGQQSPSLWLGQVAPQYPTNAAYYQFGQ